MSVTFSVAGAQIIESPCRECAQGKCVPECDGVSRATTAPDTNFANTNARRVLAALGLPFDDPLSGSMPAGDMLDRINTVDPREVDLDVLERIERLRFVVDFAVFNQANITWD